jgi:adenylate cyclase
LYTGINYIFWHIEREVTKNFEYTTLAHRYTARFPVLTYIGTQANFWIIANSLLVVIINLHAQIISRSYNIPLDVSLRSTLLIGVIMGLLYGVVLGLAGYFLDRKYLRNRGLGKVIVFKTFTSLSVLLLILALLRYVFFDPFTISLFRVPGPKLSEDSWSMVFFLLGVYYFFMTLLISFINQVNKKYGPGILIPLLLGRYRNPREEDRIFMFMDLKSSTTTAEQLGHLKYSAFIRDCFSDINEVLYPFRAQVYQYVGDEIVVTWPEKEGIKNHFCIEFFFACKRQFEARAAYYTTNYGFLPEFKAGAHAGTVTTVEIGEYKRDIAHHGDTLNTASRIQGVCNAYNKTFLISEYLLDKVRTHSSMKTEDLGLILLKGKMSKVGVVSVEWIENN